MGVVSRLKSGEAGGAMATEGPWWLRPARGGEGQGFQVSIQVVYNCESLNFGGSCDLR